MKIIKQSLLVEIGYPETPRWETQALRPRGSSRPRRPRGAPEALTQRPPNGNPYPETPQWEPQAQDPKGGPEALTQRLPNGNPTPRDTHRARNSLSWLLKP